MISVCMATYNGGKYVKEQIASIMPQLGLNDELVISDDGSCDNTLDIIEAFADPRIKVVHNNKQPQRYIFGYTSLNFENALNNASGDFIFLSDQDDVWLPDKVRLVMDKLAVADMILSDCSIGDDTLEITIKSKFGFENVRKGFWHNIVRSGYLGCCMAFRREVMKYFLPFPPDVPHDLWIGITAGARCNFQLIDTPTMIYRRHSGNVTPVRNKALKRLPGDRNRANDHSLSFKIRYRLIILWNYLKWLFKGAKS